MIVTESGLELNSKKVNVLVPEKEYDYPGANDYLQPDLIVKMMNFCFHLSTRAEEYLYLLCLNRKGQLITCFQVSHGTCSSSLAGIREIVIRALLAGAVQIVLVHNHPSGDPQPSEDDRKVTSKLYEASKLLELDFCDHIIIGGEDYFSFWEENKKAEM